MRRNTKITISELRLFQIYNDILPSIYNVEINVKLYHKIKIKKKTAANEKKTIKSIFKNCEINEKERKT